ncbi:hypothetical protein V502_03996, partial [Pseudogymnoascus sp. VKM F-4520 (FW-2644)]
ADSENLVLAADPADRATSRRRKLILLACWVPSSPDDGEAAGSRSRAARMVSWGVVMGDSTADTDAGSAKGPTEKRREGRRRGMQGMSKGSWARRTQVIGADTSAEERGVELMQRSLGRHELSTALRNPASERRLPASATRVQYDDASSHGSADLLRRVADVAGGSAGGVAGGRRAANGRLWGGGTGGGGSYCG